MLCVISLLDSFCLHAFKFWSFFLQFSCFCICDVFSIHSFWYYWYYFACTICCLYCSSNLYLLLLKFSNERNGRKCKWVWWWMVVMEKLEDMKKMLSDVNIQSAIIYAVLFVKRLLSSSGCYSLFNKNNSIIEVRCGKLKPTFYSTHFWWFWSIN